MILPFPMAAVQGWGAWIATEATSGKSQPATEPTWHQVPPTDDITLGENICYSQGSDAGERDSEQTLLATEGLWELSSPDDQRFTKGFKKKR